MSILGGYYAIRGEAHTPMRAIVDKIEDATSRSCSTAHGDNPVVVIVVSVAGMRIVGLHEGWGVEPDIAIAALHCHVIWAAANRCRHSSWRCHRDGEPTRVGGACCLSRVATR